MKLFNAFDGRMLSQKLVVDFLQTAGNKRASKQKLAAV